MSKIGIEEVEDCGKIGKVLVIDNSDKTHQNRVLCFVEKKISNFCKYSIETKWIPDEYHPTILLDKDDIEKLITKLQELIN